MIFRLMGKTYQTRAFGGHSERESVAALVASADQARDRKDWAKGAALYGRAVKADSRLKHIWVQLGNCEKESGRLDAAEDAYRKSLEIDPWMADTHLQLGHLLKLRGEDAGARASYEAALEISPTLVDAKREIATLRIAPTVFRKAPPQQVVCHFAWADDDSLTGWVFDVNDPGSAPLIEILLNDNLFRVERCVGLIDRAAVGEVPGPLGDAWRRSNAGLKILAGSFDYPIPEYVPRAVPVKVTVRLRDSQALLYEETRIFDAAARQVLADMAARHAYVRMRARRLEGDRLDIIAEYFGAERCALAIEGGASLENPEHGATAMPANMFAFLSDSQISMAEGQLDLSALPDGPARIELRRTADGARIGDDAATLPIPSNAVAEYAAWIKPEPFQIDRVMGTESALEYFFSGYATFAAVAGVLRQSTGLQLEDRRRILDWGCGVARLTQHLLHWTNADVVGIDIDASAVDWCRKKLPKGRFEKAPLDPPIGLPSAAFDLIIGISVFTHLDESAQDAWLAELQRLLALDGTLVVTVGSLRSLAMHPHPTVEYQRMRRRGMSADIGTRLDGVLPSDRGTYYRETHHAHDYIIAHWSRWFDVVAIMPGAHFNHQDYVVLRHRTPRPPPTRIEFLRGGAA